MLDFLLPHLPLGHLLARLALALVLGAAIGWERERNRKPAGLRTHMLVTLGSASFVLFGLEATYSVSGDTLQARLDPTRVIQGVVGGIGFLGAGSIIQSRGHVQGITTAASIWLSGAVGIGCGLGAYSTATVVCVFSLITLAIAGRVEVSESDKDDKDDKDDKV